MKNTGSKVKLSRRLGIALTPKASKYMDRRPYPPGEHGTDKRRARVSDYKLQLMEKQRLRAQYNIHEKQLKRYARLAMGGTSNTEDRLIGFLESRLDAVVYRAGLARTMAAARQYVNHGHIRVNNRKVDIASFRVADGDTVSVREKSRQLPCFVETAEEMVARRRVPYIERSREEMAGVFLYHPSRREVPVSCEMAKVIEFYSR